MKDRILALLLDTRVAFPTSLFTLTIDICPRVIFLAMGTCRLFLFCRVNCALVYQSDTCRGVEVNRVENLIHH